MGDGTCCFVCACSQDHVRDEGQSDGYCSTQCEKVCATAREILGVWLKDQDAVDRLAYAILTGDERLRLSGAGISPPSPATTQVGSSAATERSREAATEGKTYWDGLERAAREVDEAKISVTSRIGDPNHDTLLRVFDTLRKTLAQGIRAFAADERKRMPS